MCSFEKLISSTPRPHAPELVVVRGQPGVAVGPAVGIRPDGLVVGIIPRSGRLLLPLRRGELRGPRFASDGPSLGDLARTRTGRGGRRVTATRFDGSCTAPPRDGCEIGVPSSVCGVRRESSGFSPGASFASSRSPACIGPPGPVTCTSRIDKKYAQQHDSVLMNFEISLLAM